MAHDLETGEFSFDTLVPDWPKPPGFLVLDAEAELARELARPGGLFARFVKYLVDYRSYLLDTVGTAFDLSTEEGLANARLAQLRAAEIQGHIEMWSSALSTTPTGEIEEVPHG